MTKETFSQACQATHRSIQGERAAREKIGADWLADLERQFADEFPEDKPAQRAVENGADQRSKQPRYGEKACE